MRLLQPTRFGLLLKRHRLGLHLTQEELAERAGLGVRTVSDLERGIAARPQRETLGSLIQVLDLSPQERARFEAAAGYHPSPTSGGDARAASGVLAVNPPLVGRIRELAAIERHLDGETPPVLVLAGEPGIGKSRLLREAARRAALDGFTVLAGGGQRRRGQEPYAPLLDTLCRSLIGQPAPRVRSALAGCTWLVRLVPELMEIANLPLPAGVLAAEQERRLIFAAVARYLTNIAGPAGTLLVLDDLQWSSADGLELLASLVRPEAGGPVRVVGAYRDTEVGPDHHLSATLAELGEHNLAEQVTVGPLDRREVTELLDALLLNRVATDQDKEMREKIVRRGGGLPFFLVSCAHGLTTGATTGSEQPTVPWNVRQSIRQRVAALPPDGREMVSVAAIIGRNAPQELLVRTAERSEATALAGLDAACRARLLVDLGDRTYQFAHDVIREVIEADLGTAQCTLLHRRVGEALEQLPERERERRAAELAWHFQEGDDPERALPYAILAGDQAVRVFAQAEAENQYRVSVDLARARGRDRKEAEVLEKLGWNMRIVGRYDEALTVLDQAATIYQKLGDLEAEGQVTARIGWALPNVGKPAEGIVRLQALATRLECEGPMPALVPLYNALGHLLMRQGRFEEWGRIAARAAEFAQTATDDAAWVHGELNRGLSLMWQGHSEDALAAFEEVVSPAEALGDGESAVRALSCAANICYYRGKSAECRAHLERAVALAERMGSPNMIVFAVTCFGDFLYLRGNWPEARTHFERAASVGSSDAPSFFEAWPRLGLAELCEEEGRWEEVRRYQDEVLAIVEATGDTQSLPKVEQLRAQRDLLERQPDRALGRLKQVAGLSEAGSAFWPTLAEAYLAAGDGGSADDLVVAGVERARSAGDRLNLADWLRVRGMMLASRKLWVEAEGALREAMAHAQSLPYPYGEARAQYQMAMMRLQAGEPETARQHLQEALAIFRCLGAAKDMERTEQALENFTDA